MFTCIICKNDVPLDDAFCPNLNLGRCICLACFFRETGTELRLGSTLRREYEQAMTLPT